MNGIQARAAAALPIENSLTQSLVAAALGTATTLLVRSSLSGPGLTVNDAVQASLAAIPAGAANMVAQAVRQHGPLNALRRAHILCVAAFPMVLSAYCISLEASKAGATSAAATAGSHIASALIGAAIPALVEKSLACIESIRTHRPVQAAFAELEEFGDEVAVGPPEVEAPDLSGARFASV